MEGLVGRGGEYCLSNRPNPGYRKHFLVQAYPQPLTGSEIYQNKTWQFTSKNVVKTTKA